MSVIKNDIIMKLFSHYYNALKENLQKLCCVFVYDCNTSHVNGMQGSKKKSKAQNRWAKIKNSWGGSRWHEDFFQLTNFRSPGTQAFALVHHAKWNV